MRAILGLAGALGLATTAEGIEQVERLDWLIAEGCTEAQRFYFADPLTPESVRVLIAAGPQVKTA